jgi:hypothetical protein
LDRDFLTQKESNLAFVSHIISAVPNGPRGDSIRSANLAQDIENLMLTCRVHAKIIDDHNKVAEFPEAVLLEFKRKHEERIRTLTAIIDDAQTHVLIVQAPVSGNTVLISESAVTKAILPRYPSESEVARVDLGQIVFDDASNWAVAARILDRQVGDIIARWDRSARQRLPISLLALAPIPLLVHLGSFLGATRWVELYRREQSMDEWTWEPDEPVEALFTKSIESELEIQTRGNNGAPGLAADARPPLLILTISGAVDRHLAMTSVKEVSPISPATYELAATAATPDFLRSRARLTLLGRELREMLAVIRWRHGTSQPIHVIGAIPAPVAVELGRSLKPVDPHLIVYDYSKANAMYRPVLTVH